VSHLALAVRCESPEGRLAEGETGTAIAQIDHKWLFEPVQEVNWRNTTKSGSNRVMIIRLATLVFVLVIMASSCSKRQDANLVASKENENHERTNVVAAVPAYLTNESLRPFIGKNVRLDGVLIHEGKWNTVLQTSDGLVKIGRINSTTIWYGKPVTLEGTLHFVPVFKVPDDYKPGFVDANFGPGDILPAYYFIDEPRIIAAK
jgi:hypothetical protein